MWKSGKLFENLFFSFCSAVFPKITFPHSFFFCGKMTLKSGNLLAESGELLENVENEKKPFPQNEENERFFCTNCKTFSTNEKVISTISETFSTMEQEAKKPKKNFFLFLILFLKILFLGFFAVYSALSFF